MTRKWWFEYREVDRPPQNRRTLDDPDLEHMDEAIERALMTTLETKLGIEMLLWQFHSSPAKGRLWKKGYRVLHRVKPNRREVVAWLVPEDRPAKLGHPNIFEADGDHVFEGSSDHEISRHPP